MTKARDLASSASAFDVVSATELEYIDGVTSAVQAQLDAKLSSATAATTYQAINTNVSTTELGYLDGVTSAIQTQLNNKVAKTGDTMSGQLTVSVASGIAGEFKSASNTDAVRVSSTSTPTKFVTIKPEVITNVAQFGYWTGSGWGPVIVENGGAVNTPSIRNIYMSTSDPSGGTDGDVWIKYTA
jgi:hypothetical protein